MTDTSKGTTNTLPVTHSVAPTFPVPANPIVALPAVVRQSKAEPTTSTRVRVHVDRLQVSGLASGDRQRFVSALERELRNVALDAGTPSAQAQHAIHIPHVSAGRLRANGSPEDAAAQVARQIAKQLQPHAGTQLEAEAQSRITEADHA